MNNKSFFNKFKNNKNVSLEVLSGLTTSLALMPECIAFAIVAQLNPMVGLYTAVIICLISTIFGGRPGMISGAAGSVAVVSVNLITTYGVEYLYLAVILMGIIEILVGVFKLGKFMRLIPQPVIYGFLNGLALLIFTSQISQFKTGTGAWLTGTPLIIMIVLVAISMLTMYLFPRYTKKIPSGLVAIIVTTIISLIFGLNTKTIGDIANIASGLPTFHIPMVPVTIESLTIVFPYALLMASVGLIETLLTLNIVDEMTNTRGQSNTESIGQGIANIVCGFFQGMGGCAMIGQTMINLESGGKQVISGLTAGFSILVMILYGSALIDAIPMAALVGIMFMISINTFKWSSIKVLRYVPKADRIVLILVTVITVLLNNLALAVVLGVIISAINHAWQSSKRIYSINSYDKKHDVQYYEIHGPLFFASTTTFKELFDYEQDVETVIINFRMSRIMDQSAIVALNEVTKKYKENGIKVLLSHLSRDCLRLLDDANEFIEISILEDPYYHIPSDELD